MLSPKAAAGVLGTPGIESTAELGARIARLHELADEAERVAPLDVAVIPTTVSGFHRGPIEADVVLDEIGELIDVGATALVFSLPDDGWDERIAWLASEVLNKI